MTLLEHLKAHKGGLLRIKTELCWYGGRGWDGSPGRICLLLDAATAAAERAATPIAGTAEARRVAGTTGVIDTAAAHLLIDGAPRWVWVAEADVEVIDETV